MTHSQARAKAQQRNTTGLLLTSLAGFTFGSAALTMTGDKDFLILMALTALSTLVALSTSRSHNYKK